MNTLRRITRHAAKAVAAGTVLAATALPLIGVTAASAFSANGSFLTLNQVSSVPANPGTSSSAPVFGAGWSGTGTVTVAAGDQSNLNGTGTATFAVTTATNGAASGITFTGGTETTGSVAATISSTTSAVPGWYNLTVTDTAGSVSIPDAFYVDAAPTITSVSPTALTNGAANVTATVTGTGFMAGSTATLTNPSTGVSLGTLSYASPTTLTGVVSASSAGTYLVKVSNPDGGTASSSTVGVTVTGPSITSFSPTAIALPGATTGSTTTVTVNGTGFESGAYIATSGLTGSATASSGTYVSATQMTFVITLPAGYTAVSAVSITVHNPDNSTASYANAIGIGENSPSVTPTITAVTPAMTLPVPGSGQLNITGTGFGLPGSADTVAFQDNAGLPDSGLSCGSVNVISDTQLTCVATTANGVMSGSHSLTVTSGKTSAAFANAITVQGPTITAVSPATVSAGYQGSFTLTGTGFPTSLSGNSVATSGSQATYAEGITLGTAPNASGGTYIGDSVTGTGVASGTTVVSNSGTSATLSAPTTAWLNATTLAATYNVTGATITKGNSTTPTYDTITFAGTTTDGIVDGMTVSDTSTGNNIVTGTTVTAVSVSSGTVTVTLSSDGTTTASTSQSIHFAGSVTASQTASETVTVGSTTGIASGASVSGTNIAASATVSSVDSTNSTVTLSANAVTAPIAAGTTLTFGSTPTATVYGYNASGGAMNGGVGVSATLTLSTATSATVTVGSTGAIQSVGGMYVIVLALPTGNVDVAVSELGTLGISNVSYSSSTVGGVGAGATNQTVYISGFGFLPGATVTFAPATGITATVTSVTPTLITASVSVPSGTTAGPQYFTVTNTIGTTLNSQFAAGSPHLTVDSAPTINVNGVVPASVVAGAAATTVTISGGGFVNGATVTSSSPLLTITAVEFVSANTLTFSAAGPAINGTANVNVTLTVTNPDGGVATSGFSINPQPTVTGTYYVAPSSTNLEVFVNGTGFATSGMTVKSSSSDFTVTLASVNSTGTQAVLLVTTDAAATQGTSSTVTFTNPDGSTVSFPLNGGAAPKPVVKVAPKAIRMSGPVWTGKRTVVNIIGVGFYGQPQITSNMGGTRVGVMRDNGKVLVIVVTVAKNVHVGVHTFTLRFANGQMTSVRYNQR